ncbi:hypothetical protein B0H14DRAFT_1278819 [Mycena olivaceomarginata]|nr:hypothetical protein B0H14DRAFT_1278819 [Mycena olivaceomarginata]
MVLEAGLGCRAMSSTTPAGGTAKPRMSSRHSYRGPLPIVTLPRDNDGDDRHALSRPAADARLPDFRKPAHTPHHVVVTTTSELPRCLQNPAQRGSSKSLSVDRPSGKCGAHAARGSSPSATCRPFGRCRLPLFFLNAPAPSSPSDSSGALAQSTGHGSNGALVPHAQTPTSLRMQHSPSQSDSYSSSATSSSRRESGSGGGGRGASRHGHGARERALGGLELCVV